MLGYLCHLMFIQDVDQIDIGVLGLVSLIVQPKFIHSFFVGKTVVSVGKDSDILFNRLDSDKVQIPLPFSSSFGYFYHLEL